ncbi:hypothetical protein [Escherichia coli]|uniref:hypothetical protein n=1 Tax=Escherichia coli TaxID=562 RepID=UPI00201F20A9|nr:hypothetical protein [Escherichia coli]
MQTINNRMTETQIADLFSLAVQLQVKAEESDDRDTAILAYSIQNACSNLTESQREFRAADATIHNLELKLTDMAVQLANEQSEKAQLAAENGQMLRLLTDISENHDEYVNQDEYLYAGVPMEYVSEINAHVSRDVDAENPFKATDAFLAEVRASGADEVSAICRGLANKDGCSVNMRCSYNLTAERAEAVAAQLRKGAAL